MYRESRLWFRDTLVILRYKVRPFPSARFRDTSSNNFHADREVGGSRETCPLVLHLCLVPYP